MSAASLATSVADSTEIPTSAAWSATASLTPSPRNATSRSAARCAADQASFLLGTHAGEDGRFDDTVPEGVVVDCGDLCTTQGALDVESEVATDLLGDDGVVAGDDLDGDPELREPRE